MSMKTSYVMIQGDPMNGFTVFGPLIDSDAANRACDVHDDTWVMPLNDMEDPEGLVGDVWAMNRLAAILAGEFSADTYDELRELVEATGRTVSEFSEDEEG